MLWSDNGLAFSFSLQRNILSHKNDEIVPLTHSVSGTVSSIKLDISDVSQNNLSVPNQI